MGFNMAHFVVNPVHPSYTRYAVDEGTPRQLLCAFAYLMPGIDTATDVGEAATGYACTGEELSKAEQVISGLCAVFPWLSGGVVRIGKTIVIPGVVRRIPVTSLLDQLNRARRTANNAIESVTDAKKITSQLNHLDKRSLLGLPSKKVFKNQNLSVIQLIHSSFT